MSRFKRMGLLLMLAALLTPTLAWAEVKEVVMGIYGMT